MANQLKLAYAYYRLSDKEAKRGQSESIENQRLLVRDYCNKNSIALMKEFSDDGWSGGNFDRPGFKRMLQELDKGEVNTIITKDLSRLGRDMIESSYFAERYFPEHQIAYIAIYDDFDSDEDNDMAPFQFALNEVYLRDGSKKVKTVLKYKREHGMYCACPPYGYKKAQNDKNLLVPDEQTAPVVQRIFSLAANGESCQKIATSLTQEGVIPPLKYRVLFRDKFGEEGAARASDIWNPTTVKRILCNTVYLGHTTLGKTKKASFKSKKKILVDKDDWAVTKNTHTPLVTEEVFLEAKENIGKGTKKYLSYDRIRKSIFSKIAYCGLCGHAMCSCGTVYKGEREKYWFLACNHQRSNVADPCSGARIKYLDLVELVKSDINSLISLTDDQIDAIVKKIESKYAKDENEQKKKNELKKIESKIEAINKAIAKLYLDNIEGRVPDEILSSLVSDFQKERMKLKEKADILKAEENPSRNKKNDYQTLFSLAKQYSHIDELDQKTLMAFVSRIEIFPKVFPEGYKVASRSTVPFEQEVKIYYKFIGELDESLTA